MRIRQGCDEGARRGSRLAPGAVTVHTVILAEIEICHSRPIAPTRRVAIGRTKLPCDPAPGFGGVLLGATCARFSAELDDDLRTDLMALTNELELGRRITQPRLRHRYQSDRVGLSRSWQRLHAHDDAMVLQFDGSKAAPTQLVLGAVYAAGSTASTVRASVMGAVRRGLVWRGDTGPELLAHLASGSAASFGVGALADPVGWALGVLGLEPIDRSPDRSVVQRRFRDALREAHPDHGAETGGAADRIADITEARRILLAS